MTDAVHLSNQAPEGDALELRLREAHAALFRQMVGLEEEASEAPAEVNDQQTADRLTDLAGRIQKAERAFEAARVEAKEPFLTGGRTVDSVLGQPPKTLAGRRTTLMSRVNAHHNRVAAEARRKAEAEALRLREEAEEARRQAETARILESHQEADQIEQEAHQAEQQAAAQEKKVERAQTASTRTESGATSYQTRVRAFRITDGDAFRASFGPMAPYLDRQSVADALGRAAKADPWPTIPGVEFYHDTKTHLRTKG